MRKSVLALCAALCTAIFVIDLLVPLGVATGFAYVVVVLAAGATRIPNASLGFAGAATLLIGAGWAGSSNAGGPDHAVTNRILAAAIVWIVAVVSELRLRAEQELIRARDQIQVEQARLELALSAGSIGLWEWNLETDRVAWDQRSRRLVGAPREGPTSSEVLFARVHPEDRPRLRERAERLRLTGGEWDEEYRVVLPNGAVRWILSRGAVFPEQKRFVGIHLEISDRKNAEVRKDAFVATLAHELRNPLGPLRTVSELLEDRDPDQLERARGVIDRQVSHMARVLDDVLDASRLNRGKLTLHREVVPIAEVATQSVEQLRPKAERKKHRIDLTVPLDRCCVEGDRVRLVQVLTNLLDNAIKYTEPGGQIALTVEGDSEDCVIRVRDSGRGIDGDLLSQIFDPFAQDRSLEEAETGLGLGLHLVSRLIALHGGRVQAFSAGPGQGSEFVVTLPRVEPGSGPRAMSPNNETSEGGPRHRRVLVIDDHEDSAESLALWLEREGCRVRTAASGKDGLEAAASFQPDAVILDIGLPDLSGCEVASRLRASPDAAGPALIIALSGYGGVEATETALEAGADHYFLKPVDLTLLRNLLG